MGRSARSHQSAAERTRPTTPWPQGAAAAGSRPGLLAGRRRPRPRPAAPTRSDRRADRVAAGGPVERRAGGRRSGRARGRPRGTPGRCRSPRRPSARGSAAALDRVPQLGQQLRGDPVADGDVELAAVGEVPVDDGLAGARLGGDLVHADAGAVPADGGEGRLDELLAAARGGARPSGSRAGRGCGRVARLASSRFDSRMSRACARSWLPATSVSPPRLSCDRQYLILSVPANPPDNSPRPLHPTTEASMASNTKPTTRQAAIVGGNRIPFARSNSTYAQASNQDMLTATLDGLVARFGLQGKQRRRGRRRRRPQALARLQPDPRERAGLEAVGRRRPPTTSSRPAAPASRRRSWSPTRSRSGRSSPASPAASTPRPTRRSP